MSIATIDHGSTVATVQDAGTISPSSFMASWAQAASDAARFVAPLVKTEFVPTHFRGNVEAATAAVLYGLEVGLSPLQALQGVYVIGGKPAMYAGTMVAIVQAKGHDIWTEEISDSRVVVCGRRKGSQNTERAIFTLDRARKAGYTRNKKYTEDPQSMLLARAQADCCRRVARDALLGIAYSAEELYDEATLTADVHELPKPAQRTAKRATTATRPAPTLPRQAQPVDDEIEPDGPPLPGEDDDAEPAEEVTAEDQSKRQNTKLHAVYNDLDIKNRDDKLAIAVGIIGRPITSSKDMTKAEISKVIDKLEETATLPDADMVVGSFRDLGQELQADNYHAAMQTARDELGAEAVK